MVLAEFSMFPIGKGESVSTEIAKALDIIDRSGLPYKLSPMGTCIEGEWDQVMGAIRQCYEEMAMDSGRVYCTIKIDARKGRSGTLSSKVESVEKKLGRKLKT